MSATISVAMDGENHGWVLAVIGSEDRYVMGTTLVVGGIRGNRGDDSVPPGKGEFKAWLWPFPGGAMRLGTSTEAVTAKDVRALAAKLRKRAAEGHWWERAEGGGCVAV